MGHAAYPIVFPAYSVTSARPFERDRILPSGDCPSQMLTAVLLGWAGLHQSLTLPQIAGFILVIGPFPHHSIPPPCSSRRADQRLRR